MWEINGNSKLLLPRSVYNGVGQGTGEGHWGVLVFYTRFVYRNTMIWRRGKERDKIVALLSEPETDWRKFVKTLHFCEFIIISFSSSRPAAVIYPIHLLESQTYELCSNWIPISEGMERVWVADMNNNLDPLLHCCQLGFCLVGGNQYTTTSGSLLGAGML